MTRGSSHQHLHLRCNISSLSCCVICSVYIIAAPLSDTQAVNFLLQWFSQTCSLLQALQNLIRRGQNWTIELDSAGRIRGATPDCECVHICKNNNNMTACVFHLSRWRLSHVIHPTWTVTPVCLLCALMLFYRTMIRVWDCAAFSF